MSFVHVAALAVALLIAVPIAAHWLHRTRAPERLFAPTALVLASPRSTRSRSLLEDRWLLAVRVALVALLALLGATPWVRCSRMALGRRSGASVALALVVDDSMSMRAMDKKGRSRFDVACNDARDLVAGAREGDSIVIVLAGAPARVALGATRDLRAAATAVAALTPSDRGTELDAALSLAAAALRDLAEPDKRIVVLTDRCDGQPDARPIGEQITGAALWAPQDGLTGEVADCALLWADRKPPGVLARVACSAKVAALGRSVAARVSGKTLASRPLPPFSDTPASVEEVTIELAPGAPEPDHVALMGPSDSVPSNDQAPVAHTPSAMSIGVISDRASAFVATGGPPPVEQALEALEIGASIRPLPVVPETVEELASFQVLILDDPPGLTPEARRALASWFEKGGAALLTLGPRAASAPIGASLEPFLTGAARWEPRAPAGMDAAASALLGPSAAGLAEIHPKGRAQMDTDSRARIETLARWSDGVAWLVRRSVAGGSAFTVGLPLDVEISDLVLRPAFLALLDRVVDAAQAHGTARRIEVGGAWTFDETQQIEVRGPQGPLLLETRDGRKRATPSIAGRYELREDGRSEIRFATVPPREIDFRQRPVVEGSARQELGTAVSSIDMSRLLAFALLGLVAAETALRLASARRARRERTTR